MELAAGTKLGRRAELGRLAGPEKLLQHSSGFSLNSPSKSIAKLAVPPFMRWTVTRSPPTVSSCKDNCTMNLPFWIHRQIALPILTRVDESGQLLPSPVTRDGLTLVYFLL